MTSVAAAPTGRLPTLAATAAHHAAHRPDEPAVECAGRTVTFRELHLRSNRTAHALLAADAVPGMRIAYLGHDSEHYYDLLLACAKTGTVLVPVDPRLTPGEIGHVLGDSGAEILFADPGHLRGVEGIRPGLSALRIVVALDEATADTPVLADWQTGHPDSDLPTAPGPGGALVQMYTSGTTGAPKGVVLAQSTFWAINDLLARHDLDWLDWLPEDRSLNVLPGHHIGGPWWFLQGFRAGATNVLSQGFDDAMELLCDSRITTTLVVPSMLQILLSEPGAGAEKFTELRKVVYGGSPMPEPLLQQCLEVLGCEFAQIYGLTETCASAVCLPPADHVPGNPRLKAVGRPYPGVTVQAVDRGGNPLPPGEVGELWIDTPAVMTGYWKQPGQTGQVLADGWLHTGDAGHVDEDGYVYLHDRIKDVILVGGENVYPAEVEEALRAHPDVADAAVVGIAHEVRGEAVRACVVSRPGTRLTARDLRLFLKDRLADYKAPTDYEFLDELPRNAAGKVLRRHLRDE
ncbi:long-chain-fatty-acid--CoA ligase [Streptomyces sp. MP131-18]|uniref:long-chain-fatty-acid--CoA ligase n=1 Tax=Streptomyces sp. MP131-18 TaxID=1857892 RepID=UPI00097C0B40|nr:long-chain-fatty-acid--CoA ligase [Streptomyces sp. MP131-18]ONK10102.1 Long-chain-fatty-acid--CoA ligase [Streptomyces sp. MP131-18]